jgi:hypothetical protein
MYQNNFNEMSNHYHQKMTRNGSSNASAQHATAVDDYQVEYEVNMPIPPINVRHTPYHSLWNLHQWYGSDFYINFNWTLRGIKQIVIFC